MERFSNGQAVVISLSAHQPDEELVIHMASREGLRSHSATVVSSSPVSFGGGLRFRIELCVKEDDQPRAKGDSGEATD